MKSENNIEKKKRGSDCQERLVRLFRDENRFAGGPYVVKGIEVTLPRGKLRIGRAILPPKVKPPSIFYVGKRHTWTWTLRLWTVGISYLPNVKEHPTEGAEGG